MRTGQLAISSIKILSHITRLQTEPAHYVNLVYYKFRHMEILFDGYHVLQQRIKYFYGRDVIVIESAYLITTI